VTPYNFETARPTFMDRWQQGWKQVAWPFTIVPMSTLECKALGYQIAGFRDWFDPTPATTLDGLIERLNQAIEITGSPCFTRLTSRSPKDSLRGALHGFKVLNGAQVLALITSGSERCAADLRLALRHGVDLGIVVRPWIDCNASNEFRCFIVAKKWVGACPNFSVNVLPPSFIDEVVPNVFEALKLTLDQMIAHSSIEQGAFDLVCAYHSSEDAAGLSSNRRAYLLDANPLGSRTDFVLFKNADDLDSTFRVKTSEQVHSINFETLLKNS
jgi:D123